MGDRNYVLAIGGPAAGAEGGTPPRALRGARGALLAELAAAGLPVPAGFSISAEVSAYFDRHDHRWPPRFADELREQLRRLTAPDGGRFGDPARPLLLSVRAEAAGPATDLLPPVPNLGLSDRTLAGLVAALGGERPAWDAFRRLLHRYGTAVAGLPPDDFEAGRRRLLGKYGVASERELDAPRLQELCDSYKRIFFERSGRPFPQDPLEQLRATLQAALGRPRRPAGAAGAGGLGVAVTVCAMAFGQRDEDSAVVRACSRDAETGADRPVGVCLVRAQEDDLDAPGARPAPLESLARSPSAALRQAHAEVLALLRAIERRWRCPPEVWFVIERGRTLIVDAAPAARSGRAAVRWAVDLAAAPRGAAAALSVEEAMERLAPRDIEHFLGAPVPGDADRPPLFEAFRSSLKDARRHPDYRLYRQIDDWTRRPGRLQIYAEARDPGEVRLARRLGADGVLLEPAPAPDAAPAEASMPRVRRWIEAGRAAARDLPLIIVPPGGQPSAADLRRPGIGWLTGPPPAGAAPRRADTAASAVGYGLSTPREALLADLAAEDAAFLVVDLSRLSQACAGLPPGADPPAAGFDVAGAGQLLELAVRKARAVRHDLPILARGLSADDGAGLRCCARAGVSGVTAPVAAVPAMRLAAAQASLRH